ncbi:MAG: zinc ABC transporter substrate-binding protein [Phycisphaerales bacterium]|nr:zinc ABC transporter substrate-binding protein [Phycisphaerales bacterium]
MIFSIRSRGGFPAWTVLALLAGTLTLTSCERAPDLSPSVPRSSVAPVSTRPVQVITTFYPTTYFAQRIASGGGGVGGAEQSQARDKPVVHIECPLPDGADPIHWQPKVEEIAKFQAAELVVLNGASFELWVATASLPISRVVDTARVFESEFLRHETTTHSHGASGSHSHEGIDGHTWLDPKNAERQAEQILIAMIRRWPAHEPHFRSGFAALKADLDDLDARLKAISPQLERVALVASHPAYNYLARRYQWKLLNVDVPPDEAPTPARLDALKAAISASGRPRAVLLCEDLPEQPLMTALSNVAGLTPIVFEPAENVPSERRAAGEDYISIMHRNIQNLASAVADTLPSGS